MSGTCELLAIPSSSTMVETSFLFFMSQVHSECCRETNKRLSSLGKASMHDAVNGNQLELPLTQTMVDRCFASHMPLHSCGSGLVSRALSAASDNGSSRFSCFSYENDHRLSNWKR